MDVRLFLTLGLCGCMSRSDLYDLDGDGYMGTDDCDPDDELVHTEDDDANRMETLGGANGIDDDCDGSVDEHLDEDLDGALRPPAGDDCDDTNSEVYPTLEEIPRNGLDDNCDGEGTTWTDTVDLDGLASEGSSTLGLTLDTRGGLYLGASANGGHDLLAPINVEEESRRNDLLLGNPGSPDGALCTLLGEAVSEGGPQEQWLNCTNLGIDEEYSAGWGVALGRFAGPELAVALTLPKVGDTAPHAVVLFNEVDLDAEGGTQVTLPPPGESDGLLYARTLLRNVGDLGRDGQDELFVGAEATADEEGWLVGVLYLGTSSSDALPTPRAVVAPANPGQSRSASRAGDLDGDGASELVIGLAGLGDTTAEEPAPPGYVYVIHGGASLDDVSSTTMASLALADAELIVRGSPGWSFGYAVEAGSDLDGDGLDDLLVGAPGATNTWDVSGGAGVVFAPVPGAGEVSAMDGAVFYNPDPWARAGASVALPGDTDADGQADALIGSGPYTSSEDAYPPDTSAVAWLLLDPADGGPGASLPLAPSATVVAFTSAPGSTWAVASVGDLDLAPTLAAQRAGGAEILIVNQSASPYTTNLLWGRGM